MSSDDTVVCPDCNRVNPIECNEASCPLESYFWEWAPNEGPDE